jgi:hypothetical protein
VPDGCDGAPAGPPDDQSSKPLTFSRTVQIASFSNLGYDRPQCAIFVPQRTFCAATGAFFVAQRTFCPCSTPVLEPTIRVHTAHGHAHFSLHRRAWTTPTERARGSVRILLPQFSVWQTANCRTAGSVPVNPTRLHESGRISITGPHLTHVSDYATIRPGSSESGGVLNRRFS